MNKHRKLITIGITAFNEKEFLLEAWNSVVNQSDNNWEAIMILDGGADRETQKIFESISHDSLIKINLVKNKGPYFTRSLAIENAKTDWYCHLDADDRIPINMVRHINKAINDFPDIDFIIGSSLYFDNINFQVKNHQGILDNRLAYTLPFNGQSPIKKELFNRLGGFNKDFFRGGADWEFWLKVVESKNKGKRLHQIIYERRYRQNNVGSSWLNRRPENALKMIKMHPQFFKDQKRTKLCLSKAYELAAREFKRIGSRKEAYKLALKAKEFGNKKQNIENIIQEGKMSFWRYKLRRLGRLL
ncbi:MAG: glycosyltransferase family 2 protein [Candidatus Marinimicrobia bacterium]|nr:glycosyltransferase family 2 protein [Candidatus Neomarinimicrobiota bacterium]